MPSYEASEKSYEAISLSPELENIFTQILQQDLTEEQKINIFAIRKYFNNLKDTKSVMIYNILTLYRTLSLDKSCDRTWLKNRRSFLDLCENLIQKQLQKTAEYEKKEVLLEALQQNQDEHLYVTKILAQKNKNIEKEELSIQKIHIAFCRTFIAIAMSSID